MSNNVRLLQQIRHAGNFVAGTSGDPEHQALMTFSDVMLNELLLQETPDFYLDYIASGKDLLAEGQALATERGGAVSPVSLRDDLNPELRNSVFDDQIQILSDALVGIVSLLDENDSEAERNFLCRVSDWEELLYKHRGEQVESTVQSTTQAVTDESVRRYLEKKFPDRKGIRINSLTNLYGGISKQTTLLDTEDEVDGQQSVVFRIESGLNIIHYDGCDVSKEYYVIELMHKHGIPVPRPLWLEEDASYLGGRFIAMEKAPGINRGAQLGSDTELPEAAVEAMLAVFYKLHNLEIDPKDPLAAKSHLAEWLHCKTITDANRYNVNEFIPNEIDRSGIKASPELVRALRWAQANVPECDETPVINHLDYSFHNLLFDGDEISAILDWETSRIGDPIDDIIWTQNSLQSQMTMEQFLQRYKQATGREISEYRIAYSRIIKYLFNLIGALNALQKLNSLDSAPIKFSLLPYKYTPLINVGLNQLIANAEAVRNK